MQSKRNLKVDKEGDSILNTLVNETTEHGDIPVDIYTKLSNNRILFITDEIDDKLAVDITGTLLLKDSEDSNKKISLFINSEGGDIRCVFMIYDIMQLLQCPVETICVGSAMNEVVLLLAAGTPGMRHATQNSVICPSQLVQDKYYYSDLTDAQALLSRIQKDNKNLMSAIANKTGKKLSQVLSDFERKKFMNAKQAKSYGIIDNVIGN